MRCRGSRGARKNKVRRKKSGTSGSQGCRFGTQNGKIATGNSSGNLLCKQPRTLILLWCSPRRMASGRYGFFDGQGLHDLIAGQVYSRGTNRETGTGFLPAYMSCTLRRSRFAQCLYLTQRSKPARQENKNQYADINTLAVMEPGDDFISSSGRRTIVE